MTRWTNSPEVPFEEAVAASAFQPLRIDFTHAAVAGALPPHHADPFDRMLVAQAQAERFALVTHDRQCAAYDVPIRVDVT